MDTQFGIAHVWQQGDWVTRCVALILLGMSVTSWIVIIAKGLNLRRHRAQAHASQDFWHSQDFAGGLGKLHGSDNPFRQLAQEGQDATRHVLHLDGETSAQLRDSLDVSEWVTRSLRNSIDDFTARLQSGLSVLASIGSTAPFVGLFGTVWGIYHALLSIGAAGQATIDKVAGPVGEALVMTAAGLAVAIPAVLAYNVFGKRVAACEADLEGFAHDLRELFKAAPPAP